MNNINLTGRLTKDLELKARQSGDGSYAFFTIAVDEGKDKNGNKLTEFIDCIAYNQQANFLSNYAGKGDLIEVSGKLHVSLREEADGSKTKRVTVKAFNVGICSKVSANTANTAKPTTPAPAPEETSSEIPTYEEGIASGVLPFEI